MANFDLKKLQSAIAQSGNRWEAGKSLMADLSDADFQLRLGAEPPPGTVSLSERESYAAQAFAQDAQTINENSAKSSTATPALWDWRNFNGKNYLGSVRDQKNCGSCVSFGTIAAIEATTRVATNQPAQVIDLSEAHLFYCHAAAEGRNCGNGWWPSKALDAVKLKGVVDEACFPYTPGDQSCRTCADAATRTSKITGWQSLKSVAMMKAWISEKGPLVGCFTVYEDFRHYTGGVYHHVSGPEAGGHCICIVGYSDADQAWIIRNSWGADWAENGYGRIGYGEAGIDYEMWGVSAVNSLPVNALTRIENVLITGLWMNAQASQASAYIDGLGWRKLSCSEFVTLAAAARVAKARCTISTSSDAIVELYVM
jgi:C1A family cysteine protease